MNRAMVLVLLACLCGPAAGTPSDPRPDGIGIYFDLDGISNHADPALNTTVTAYLLITNVASPSGISGWAASLLLNPTTFPAGLSIDLGPGSFNVLSPPVFQVGLMPSRTGNPILLATITTVDLGTPIYFGIGQVFPTSDFGLPCYAQGDNPAILRNLTPSSNVPWTLPVYGNAYTGWLRYLVACTHCPPVVASERASWGGVKALY